MMIFEARMGSMGDPVWAGFPSVLNIRNHLSVGFRCLLGSVSFLEPKDT